MYVFARSAVTLGIWIMVMIMLSNVAVFASGNIVPLTFILSVAAAASTGFIWNARLGGDSDRRRQVEIAGKAKRDDRMGRLLSSLSDDEIDDLRQRLMAREDGEISTTLEELLAERERRRYDG
jgi:hypothetical protein